VALVDRDTNLREGLALDKEVPGIAGDVQAGLTVAGMDVENGSAVSARAGDEAVQVGAVA
jgi:hypothetical protein